MITFNVDNMSLFYLGMSILALAFAIVTAFGKTEEGSHKRTKRTTTS